MAEPGPCTTEVITRLSWRWSISNRRQRAQHDPAVYLAAGLGDPYRRASGESYLRGVTGHSHTTVVPAPGGDEQAAGRCPGREGWRHPRPFQASNRLPGSRSPRRAARTGSVGPREGSEVTEFAGSDAFGPPAGRLLRPLGDALLHHGHPGLSRTSPPSATAWTGRSAGLCARYRGTHSVTNGGPTGGRWDGSGG